MLDLILSLGAIFVFGLVVLFIWVVKTICETPMSSRMAAHHRSLERSADQLHRFFDQLDDDFEIFLKENQMDIDERRARLEEAKLRKKQAKQGASPKVFVKEPGGELIQLKRA